MIIMVNAKSHSLCTFCFPDPLSILVLSGGVNSECFLCCIGSLFDAAVEEGESHLDVDIGAALSHLESGLMTEASECHRPIASNCLTQRPQPYTL